MNLKMMLDVVLSYFQGVGHLRRLSREGTNGGYAEVRVFEIFYVVVYVGEGNVPRISVWTGADRFKNVFFGRQPLECVNVDEVMEMCERISEWCLMLVPFDQRERLATPLGDQPPIEQWFEVLGPAQRFLRDSLHGAEPLVYALSASFRDAIHAVHITEFDVFLHYVEPYLFALAHGPIQFTIDPRLAGEDSLAGQQWKILRDFYGYHLDPTTLVAVTLDGPSG